MRVEVEPRFVPKARSSGLRMYRITVSGSFEKYILYRFEWIQSSAVMFCTRVSDVDEMGRHIKCCVLGGHLSTCIWWML